MAKEDRKIRTPREIQSMALTVQTSAKTHVASDSVGGSYDQCGRSGENDQEVPPKVVGNPSKLHFTESMLKLRDTIETQCTGRQGLGTSHFQQYGKADTKQRRAMIQKKCSGPGHRLYIGPRSRGSDPAHSLF
ncbi:unnamed protein product [Pleuronectes platessa]|uniref:Uncharacterized protein n=1 Tax=Pleuronectes platessa TaxID=8262 RepID=A0A9N7TKF6_PLEPL|nr:unnamed protein product [Pleuronectes platessa]